MLRFILVRLFAAAIAVLVFTLTLLAAASRSAHGAEPSSRPTGPGWVCVVASRVVVRPSDGALVTRWSCVRAGGARDRRALTTPWRVRTVAS